MLKFWSNIGLILQIAIVIAAVVAFTFFDPFGIFNTRKQTLVDTPVSVRSIREIGKLITAEYYGEVLTSLQESLIDKISEQTENEWKEIETLQEQFQESMLDLYGRKADFKIKKTIGKAKKLYDFFYREYPSLTQNPYYQTYIDLLIEKEKEKSGRLFKLSEKKFLKILFDQKTEEAFFAKITELKIEESRFDEKQKAKQDVLTADKKFCKKQIVVLGRGWVKAGINFEKFTEANFRYDQDRRTIHIIGMVPEILVHTINPWFIPEKKVKGFEIVLITKKANDPAYMNLVKQQSLDKLRQKAIQAGILDQAKTNAEQNLLSFFNLLLAGGLDQVIIHDSFLSYFDQSFLPDSLTYHTMQSIDSLMLKLYPTDSMAVMGLVDSLKSKALRDTNFVANRYYSYMSFTEDQAISNHERHWFVKEKNRIDESMEILSKRNEGVNKNQLNLNNIALGRLDTIWFYPEASIVTAYKKQVDADHPVEMGFFSRHYNEEEYKKKLVVRSKHLTIKVYQYMLSQKLNAFNELVAMVEKNINQLVEESITYVNKQDESETNTTTPSGQEIRYTDLSDMEVVTVEQTIQQWQKKIDANLKPEELVTINRLMKKNWRIQPSHVVPLRDSIQKNGKIAIVDKTDTVRLKKVDRFSAWYTFVTDFTLDNTELNTINSYHNFIQSDSTILSKPVTELKDKWETSTTIGDLEKAWYYPSDKEVEGFKNEAESMDFGTNFFQFKKRKAFRSHFVTQTIFKQIQEARRKDFELFEQDIKDFTH